MAPGNRKHNARASVGRPQKRRRHGVKLAEENVAVLPVCAHAEKIGEALGAHDVLLLIGETGSGKTTQLPQQLVSGNPDAFIVVTQPRRVAAMSVASRVAFERGGQVGTEVGYAVRFDDNCGPETQIRYVTDGVLLREALSTDGLSRYTHVVVDEVHERSVNTDIVLGVVKRALCDARKAGEEAPFKLVVMSATTDAKKLSTFFAHQTSLTVHTHVVPGRLYPVETLHVTEPVSDFVDGAVTAALQVHVDYALPGDILVFLPGQDEITSAVTLLKERVIRYLPSEIRSDVRIHSLYASLPAQEQMRAIAPLEPGQRDHARKVIFSTNIAETSLTIAGVKYVIDSGLAKMRSMQAKNAHADVLRLAPISKAQAAQRAGRAGRVEAGIVFRLYTEKIYDELAEFPHPEIIRVDPAPALLQIAAMGGSDSGELLRRFPWVDRPPRRALAHGLETLVSLGALDHQMALTEIGTLMATIPVAPKLARALLESIRIGCVDAAVAAAAMLSVEGGVFLAPAARRDAAKSAQRRFMSGGGDTLALVNALEAFAETKVNGRTQFCQDHFLNYRSLTAAMNIREQLRQILTSHHIMRWASSFHGSTGDDAARWKRISEQIADANRDELLLRCIVAGFFRNCARRRDDGKYSLMAGGGSEVDAVDIHPASVLRGKRGKGTKIVIFNELVITTKPYLRNVVAVKEEWLWQHSNGFFTKNVLY